jgi:hypothetical protein
MYLAEFHSISSGVCGACESGGWGVYVCVRGEGGGGGNKDGRVLMPLLSILFIDQ